MTDMKVVVDVSTGEHKYIPLSAEEIAEREALAAQLADEQAAREAAEAEREALKESARAKLVSGTPLTEEEAALLIV